MIYDNKVRNSVTAIRSEFYQIGFDSKFEQLYSDFEDKNLIELLSTLHSIIVEQFSVMNRRLPTNDSSAHYWAENSRELLRAILALQSLQRNLKGSYYEFVLDDYYQTVISHAMTFLSDSGGSEIPPHSERVNLYYEIPILYKANSVYLEKRYNSVFAQLTPIGSGSYATVYSFEDPLYQKEFVLKRAKEELTEKELERFRQEFDIMNSLSSPYLVEVFSYGDDKDEYIMEKMDFTLSDYIQGPGKNSSNKIRRSISCQILKALIYLHSQNYLHRDLSPNNILLKVYDDGSVIVKIGDFGLVKIPESDLTSVGTEMKGISYNDPALFHIGFAKYALEHEIFALTKLVYFTLTGNFKPSQNLALNNFYNTGTNSDSSKRFKDVNEMYSVFLNIPL